MRSRRANCQPPHQDATASALAAWVGTGVRRVLVVDDSPANRAYAQAMLTRVGIESDAAENGAEAVERARHVHYDLILMDIAMPIMDGFTAAQTIRALPRGNAKTPIIAVTANSHPEDRLRCMDVGMNGYVPKPFDRQELLATIAGTLQLSKADRSIKKARSQA